MNEIKMPANCAYIAEDEMSYLTGGGIVDAAANVQDFADNVSALMQGILDGADFVDFMQNGFEGILGVIGVVVSFTGIFYNIGSAVLGFSEMAA